MDANISNVYKVVKKSRLVNEKWYRETYPDVGLSGLDAITHYLKYGWRLRRNPCKRFDTAYYLTKYKHSMQEYDNPLLDYIFYGQKAGNYISPDNDVLNNVSALAEHLWGGHPNSALNRLLAIAEDESVGADKRWMAAWQVSRRYYFEGRYSESLQLAKFLSELESKYSDNKEVYYLFAFCYMYLGDCEEANKVISDYIKKSPGDADGHLALANTLRGQDALRLKSINQAYALSSLSPICLVDEALPLSMSNIRGQAVPVSENYSDVKVSIIMPIYNAADKIEIAIESLLHQNHRNLEIIAVDDCSTDGTCHVVEQLQKSDSRVKLIKAEKNGGAYAARNLGLRFCTGDLITTHDSDDWSHPEKISTQVFYLQMHPKVMGCSVHWVRCLSNLEFTQNWRPSDSLVHWCQSSFMFRKKVYQDVGAWDEVRIGGDTEYIFRMQSHYGKSSFAKIKPEAPLAFALDEESSLTRTKSTHVSTVYFGLRHLYRTLAVSWHKRNNNQNIVNEGRFFKAPATMYDKSSVQIKSDVLLCCDFSSVVQCDLVLEFVSKSNLSSIALFHWPDFESKPKKIQDKFYDIVSHDACEVVVAGQVVTCHSKIIGDLNLLKYIPDPMVEIESSADWVELSESNKSKGV